MSLLIWGSPLLYAASVASNLPVSSTADDCSMEYPHCNSIDDDDVARLDVVVGKVVALSAIQLCADQPPFVTLSVATKSDSTVVRTVFVAPSDTLSDLGLALKVGDAITVMGVSSWHSAAGEMTAVQIETGDGRSVFLRDPFGRPVWLERPRDRHPMPSAGT